MFQISFLFIYSWNFKSVAGKKKISLNSVFVRNLASWWIISQMLLITVPGSEMIGYTGTAPLTRVPHFWSLFHSNFRFRVWLCKQFKGTVQIQVLYTKEQNLTCLFFIFLFNNMESYFRGLCCMLPSAKSRKQTVRVILFCFTCIWNNRK